MKWLSKIQFRIPNCLSIRRHAFHSQITVVRWQPVNVNDVISRDSLIVIILDYKQRYKLARGIVTWMCWVIIHLVGFLLNVGHIVTSSTIKFLLLNSKVSCKLLLRIHSYNKRPWLLPFWEHQLSLLALSNQVKTFSVVILSEDSLIHFALLFADPEKLLKKQMLI